MGEINVDLGYAQPDNQLNRSGKVSDGLGAEDTIRFQSNPGPGEYSRNRRRENTEASLFSGEILGQAIEAQSQGKRMLIKEFKDLIRQEASVCGQ